jgi:hypothetical protein
MSSTPGTQTTTPSRVATSTSAATLVAAGQSRRMVHIFNESTAILYIKFGAAASATDYTLQIAAGGYYETPSGNPYSGLITGILASGTGFAQITAY